MPRQPVQTFLIAANNTDPDWPEEPANNADPEVVRSYHKALVIAQQRVSWQFCNLCTNISYRRAVGAVVAPYLADLSEDVSQDRTIPYMTGKCPADTQMPITLKLAKPVFEDWSPVNAQGGRSRYVYLKLIDSTSIGD